MFSRMKCLRQRYPRVYEIAPAKYQIDVRGKRFEAIRLTLTNGRKRLDFSNRQEALDEAGKIEQALLSHGTERLNDIAQFVSNGELTVLADALTIHGKTLADAGRFYLDHLNTEKEKRQSRPVSELFDEWVQAKRSNRNKPLRSDSLNSISSKATEFKRAFEQYRIKEITRETVEQWLNGLAVSGQTREHKRNYLGQFFNWCIKRGFTEVNPAKGIEIHVDDPNPRFFTVEEVETTLTLLAESRFYADFLPFHLIGFFAGVRPEETARLTWNNVLLDGDNPYIFVPGEVSKTHFKRNVYLSQNLCRWLKWWKSKFPKLPLIPKRDHKDALKRFRKHLPFNWISDGMRHSFATYHLARHSNLDLLEDQTGTAKSTLKRHYIDRAAKQEAERYWSIVPHENGGAAASGS
jgi:integrase